VEKDRLIEKLQNYNYYIARLEEVQERIESICTKLTATYGNLAGGSSNTFKSKVEDEGNKKHDLKARAESYKKRIAGIEKLIDHSGLTEREKELMWWIAKNGKISVYASINQVGKWNLYKIRDRAVEKIIAAHYTTKGKK